MSLMALTLQKKYTYSLQNGTVAGMDSTNFFNAVGGNTNLL